MAAGVVKVGRRIYAVGLFWQPSPSGRVAQAAREAAQQPGQNTDFYCARPASKNVAIPQYGLGQSSMGHKAGMPTLAASLANAQPGSWAGAFRLREGTWFVVVRDDLIAPDGDVLFESDDAARDRLLQEVSLGGVQRVYAPDSWSVPGSDPTPLPLLLQDRVECRLQPVRLPTKLLIYGAVAGGVVLLLIFLALQWQAEQERIEQERIQLEQQAKQRAEDMKKGLIGKMAQKWEWPPAEEIYEKKWELRPYAGEIILGCKGLFAQVYASQLGWKRGPANCKESDLTVQWNRERKSFGIVPDQATVRDDLGIATQTVKGNAFQPRGVETLISVREVSAIALSHNWPVMTSRLPDDTPKIKPPPEVKDPPPPPPPPWVKRSIKYTGKIPPWEIWAYFETMPGLIMDKIGWDGVNWTMELTLYERRGG
jgi:hypothetical protein